MQIFRVFEESDVGMHAQENKKKKKKQNTAERNNQMEDCSRKKPDAGDQKPLPQDSPDDALICWWPTFPHSLLHPHLGMCKAG